MMTTDSQTYTDHRIGDSYVERCTLPVVFGNGTNLGTYNYDRQENHGYTRELSANPNFLSKIKKGEIVMSSYQRSGTKNNFYVPCSGIVAFNGGYNTTDYLVMNNGPLIDYEQVLSVLGTYTVNVASNKVLAATDAQAKMLSGAAQTAVAWVERYKTLSLLATSANRLITILRSARSSIRRGNGIKELREYLNKGSLDDAMNLWMEYRYGWRPLLYDIASHQQAIANILSDAGRYWKSKGTSDIQTTTEVSGVDLGVLSTANIPVKAVGDVKALPKRVGAIAGYFYKIDQSAINPALYWLGFQSPTAVIWELVPYSFVVDWFANVGDYLTSLSTFPAFIRDPHGFLSTSQTWLVNASTTSITHSAYNSSVYSSTLSFPSASWEVYNFTRELISPGDYTGLRFDVNLNLAKVIDLFVLARNLAGSNRTEANRKLRT
jgi:hypothetical protein